MPLTRVAPLMRGTKARRHGTQDEAVKLNLQLTIGRTQFLLTFGWIVAVLKSYPLVAPPPTVQ